MTNNNQKSRIRAYMAANGVNYTTAKRALSSAALPTGPIAYVRETWPIANNPRSIWDGDLLQVVVDCPFCDGQHRHGGRISDGRNHLSRSTHCTKANRRPGDEYTIYDARPRRTVSPRDGIRYDGPWPGDPEPTVEMFKTVLAEQGWDAAVAFVQDTDLPPVTLRTAWEFTFREDAETDEDLTAAALAVLANPKSPDDIRDDAFYAIRDLDNKDALLALAASPGIADSGLSNSLITRECGGDHDLFMALAANPVLSADTLGWISEHATGFLHPEGADVDLSRLILKHPNLDNQVWGFFVDRPEHCARIVLEAPRCDAWAASLALGHAGTEGDIDLAVQATEFLVRHGDESYVTGWLDYEDEANDALTITAVREALDRLTT